MNATRICEAESCDRKVFARQKCRRHWQEWRDSTAPKCSVGECELPSRAQGLCNKHWQRRNYRGTFDDPVRKTADERFFEKVDKTDSCWLWRGALFDTGYGAFNAGWIGGKSKIVSAHRYAYERIHGKQPSSMHLDHLCRVRECCNPEHLELVTPEVNSHRGSSGPKATCKRGHSMSDAYVRPDTGTRMCRTCADIRSRNRERTKAYS